MHHAPSVNFPVGRSFLEAALISSFGLISGMVCLWVALGAHMGMTGLSLIWAVWVGVLAGSWWRWWARPSMCLRFVEGQAQLNGQDAVLTVHLDLGRCMLLKARLKDGRSQWAWAEQRSSPWQWHALRCAVYCKVL